MPQRRNSARPSRDRSSIRARPPCRCDRHRDERRDQRGRDDHHQPEGNYTLPFLRPGLYTLTVEMSGFQKYVAQRTCGSRSGRPRRSTCQLVGRRLGGGGTVAADSPLLETSNANRGTVIDSAPHRRAAAAVAQPDGARNARGRRQLQRPGDLPAPVRQRRARRLVDERRREPQQRVPARRRRRTTPTRAATTSPTCRPPKRCRNSRSPTNSYDAQYGRTAGGVVNMSLKSGTNSFHGVGYEFLRRKWLGRQLVPAQLAQQRQRPISTSISTASASTARSFRTRQQDVLPVHRREVPRRHAGAAVQHRADRGDEERRLQQPGRRHGQLITIYDPATGRDVNGVWTRDPFPSNRIPADRINPAARAMHAVLPGRRTTRSRGRRRGRTTWPTRNTSTRTCSGTGSARSTTISARTTASFFRWGENERQRDPQHHRDPHRAGPERPAAAHPRQPRGRRRLGAHLRRRHGVQPARRLQLVPRVEPVRRRASASMRPTFGFPPAWSSQLPSARARGLFPRHRRWTDYVQLSRGIVPNTQQELVAPAEHLADPGRAQHPQRARHPLDQRLQRELRQRRRPDAASTAHFTRSTLNSTGDARGNAFASFLLGAPSGGDVDVNIVPALQVDLRGALDPGRLAGQQQADVEPRLPLGLQRPGQRRGQPAELHLRPDDRQSGVGARRSAR